MKHIGKALEKLRPPLAVLCDYDDTTAMDNVAELIMARFGDNGWHEMRAQFRSGHFTLREYQEASFASVNAGRDEMMAVVRDNATLRDGFKELHAYCRRHDIPLAVVSNGLDFYVEALLQREGLDDVPFYTVQTRFSGNGIEFLYPYAQKGCSDFGNCKCMVLEKYRSQGRKVLYAGDGRSDFCAAASADLVFARSDLVGFCETYGIDYLPLGDFGDVLNVVKKITEEANVD
jgi:2,3-diketo-5-methylthio-1-phosphopentane phosphatase